MRSAFLKFSCSLVVLLVIAGSILVVSRSQEATEVYTTEVIRSPLSTMPAPVLVGQQFTATVAVAPSATQWAVVIEDKYKVYSLNVSPLGYAPSGEAWQVNATVSNGVEPGLYALKVSVVVDGKNSTYTQPRSVWVMSHYPEEFQIAHLTDVHYILKPDMFRQAIAQLNFLCPTVAIITGDQADVGSSEREVRDFWMALQEADFPTYCVPGNHDYQGGGQSNYVKYEGPLNYSVDMGFAYFVALDTDFDRAYVTVDQTRWAGRMLSNAPASKFKIIGFHHPIFGNTSVSTAMNITASWESTEELTPLMYYSWKETEKALEAAKELLRMVQEQNVDLILQGHIHRDQVFILNQENYFVVSSPVGGPHAASMPYGYRMITVENNRITGLTYLDRPLSTLITGDKSHSIPIELLEVRYGPTNDGSSAAVTAILRSNWGEPVSGTAEMAVSKDYPIDQYTTFPELIPHTVVEGPSAYYLRFEFTLSPGDSLRFTVATAPDLTPPTIDPPDVSIIPLGPKYSIKLEPEITDIGWGVENATLLYLLESATDWEEAPMTRGSGNLFEASISGILINETVSYRIVAHDYAGHKAETESQMISSQQTTTSATETTSIEATTATTTTPTTTTRTSSVTPSTPATTETSTYSTTSTPSTTTETTSVYPTTTVTTSSTPSTTEGPPAETNLVLIAAVVVVVIVVLAVALLIRRRSSQPGKS